MSKIYTAADQLIGHTPLLELTHIEKEQNLSAHLIAKLEYFNPAGSVKDRIAKKMIDDAEAKGLLKEGLRCRAGAERGCQGHEGCHCQGRRAGKGDPQLLHPRPVREPGQPPGPH